MWVWAQPALLFNSFFLCSALLAQQGLQKVETPTCVMTETGPLAPDPPVNDAPTSWNDASSQSVHQDQDCYAPVNDNAVIDSGRCCCGFWAAPPEEQREFARNPSCTISYPVFSHSAPNAECADVAIAVSGSLRDANTNLFDKLAQVFVDPANQANISVHVFVHIGSDVLNTDISSLPPFVKKIIVEDKSGDAQVEEAITNCTGGAIATLLDEMARRYEPYGGFRDGARFSIAPMYRHLFLSHDMVRTTEQDMNCKYKYILRSRPDFAGDPFDWQSLMEKLQQGKVQIGAARGLFDSRASGVSHPHRCIVDDQLSIGTPEQMYAYSSVFPDFKDFAKYLPLYRADFRGHTNERILTAHLHYRGLGDAFEDFPHDLRLHALATREADADFDTTQTR